MVAFALSLILGYQMYGSPDQKVRDEIQATYDGYAKAVLSHDLDGTMNFLTPDIVWVYANGKEQHRSEIRDGLKQWEDSIKPGTKMHFTIEKLDVKSDDKLEAFVTLHVSTPEMIAAKEKERTSKWHDTWVKTHGRWQNIRGEQLARKGG